MGRRQTRRRLGHTVLILVALVVSCTSAPAADEQLALPPHAEAEGFGAAARGGSGGRIEDPPRQLKVYACGNLSPLTPAGASQWSMATLHELAGGKMLECRPAPAIYRAETPFPAPTVTTQAAAEACQLVLDRAGAKVRDEADARLVREVRGYLPRTP
jgi:hypothetical protein